MKNTLPHIVDCKKKIFGKKKKLKIVTWRPPTFEYLKIKENLKIQES